jgi:Alr-MurF fusion protein
MLYSIKKIQEILNAQSSLGAHLTADLVGEKFVSYLVFDSRRLTFADQSLFFALTGQRLNGHSYLRDAYEKGIRFFVVSASNSAFLTPFPDAVFLYVPDVLKSLQTLAHYHRRQFPALKVVGITGSNGKTMVKEWLFQLLNPDFSIVRSPKSYNSQVGVPLSVWGIEPRHNLAIFEAGVSLRGEMAKLAPLIQPEIGIFTLLGTAHSEGFSNDAEKLREKLQLFNTCKTLIYSSDDAPTRQGIQDFFKENKTLEHRTWSFKNAPADLQIHETLPHVQTAGVTLNGRFRGRPVTFDLPFSDTISANNACACWLALQVLGIPDADIAARMHALEPVEMRLELKTAVNGSLLVNDAYNTDLTSLALALDFMVQQSGHLSRTLILSDILQSGQAADVLYQKVAELVLQKKVQRFIGIGSGVATMAAIFAKTRFENENEAPDFQFFANTDAFLTQIKNTDFKSEIILLKGARAFEFERIAQRLVQKAHKTVLEINLDALLHNLRIFTRLLQSSRKDAGTTKIMAMVKARAYGNGSDEVARLLAFHKVEYLAVAYTDEGIELRQAGISLPIMVMNPNESSFDALCRYQLEPEIYSLRLLGEWVYFIQNLRKRNAMPEATRLKIHLKFDTGMHRLGFESVDIQGIIKILQEEAQAIEVASVFTHLVASEAAQHDGFTELQAARFNKMYAELVQGLGYQPMRHVLNSNGIGRFAQYQFEMVRLGIGLYGLAEEPELQAQLAVVQTLKATISQIRVLAPHETVGYGRRGVVTRESRIATLSIGYADGLPRAAGNGQFSVGLHGKKAPIVGSVCMDMTMVDVTDIPEAREGDSVEIFGAQVPVNALAAACQTIPYEIFTSISERVKRVYFQE